MKSKDGCVLVGGYLVTYAGYSDAGRLRSINEDDFLLLPEKGIFCLADGLGGLDRGEVASVTALESIRTLLSTSGRARVLSFPKKNATMQQMIRHANSTVYKKRQQLKLNTATTMVIVHIRNHTIEIGHVGDSRAYLWDGNSLLLCTKDHSLVEELHWKTAITKEQLLQHPQQHIITRAVGAEREVDADIQELDIQDGNLVLLCSDGLTTMVAHAEIESILSSHYPDVEQAGQALVAAANDAGGRDNVTVVLLHLVEAPKTC